MDAYILFYDSTTISADPDNVALIRNDITYEDMTVTIATLKADSSNNISQSNFYDLHKINVIDIFNNGNFVNGDDNPIINSNLKKTIFYYLEERVLVYRKVYINQ